MKFKVGDRVRVTKAYVFDCFNDMTGVISAIDSSGTEAAYNIKLDKSVASVDEIWAEEVVLLGDQLADQLQAFLDEWEGELGIMNYVDLRERLKRHFGFTPKERQKIARIEFPITDDVLLHGLTARELKDALKQMCECKVTEFEVEE